MIKIFGEIGIIYNTTRLILKQFKMAIRLVIFANDEKLRRSITNLFEYSDEYILVGTYGDVFNATKELLKDKPEVVLLDIDMPKKDGISAIPVIKAAMPLVMVIIYTQSEDEEIIFDSLCAGADGYILKNTSPIKLFEAIKEVKNGGVPLSPAVAKKILKCFHRDKRISKGLYGLTERECDVLDLLVKGYSIKQIASELHIAFDTCRSHLRNIYHKLNVNCGKEAIAKVLAEHIKF